MIDIEKRLNKKNRSTSVFDLNGVPSIKNAIPLSLQHLLAMIVGNVTPAIIVAGVTGTSSSDKALLVQCSLLIAGIATLLQLYPIWKLGSGLPIVMGVGFAYVPTLTAIGSAYGIEAIFGAQLIGGIVAVLVGIFIKPLRRLFPPLVAGTVVFTIGLSLYPTAIKYMAGGEGAADFGSLLNWAIAFITLAVVLFCNHFTKGYFKLASILVGIVVGYVFAIIFNKVDFSSIANAALIEIPRPLHFGIKFYPSAILSIVIMYIVDSVQTIGQYSVATEGGLDRDLKDSELSSGIIGNGVVNIIGAFFGGLPTSTYGQNIGIVAMTKVVSKFIIALSAIFMLIAGLIPKIGAAITTVPQSVLGGATIIVFATITMTGIKLIMKEELSSRNITVVGLSVALGVGITQVQGALDVFPEAIRMLVGSSPVVLTTISVIFLNLILPKQSIKEEENERKQMDTK
jgi:xanthine permease